MKTIITQLRRTYDDLSHRWSPFGAFFVVTLAMASVFANILQIISYFPSNRTINIPIMPLVFLGIIGVAALSSLALQLRSSDVVFKRTGATQLTDVWVIESRGELYYGSTRNVLLRLGSIKEILNAIFTIAQGTIQASTAPQHLYDLGKRIGGNFADQFVDQPGLEARTLVDMIDAWCEYDIEAGWGRFMFSPSSSEFMGSIQIRSNFLTALVEGRRDKDIGQSLCSFLEGYISGILEVFARVQYPLKNWNVEVKERECGVNNSGLPPCEFDFLIKEASPGSIPLSSRPSSDIS